MPKLILSSCCALGIQLSSFSVTSAWSTRGWWSSGQGHTPRRLFSVAAPTRAKSVCDLILPLNFLSTGPSHWVCLLLPLLNSSRHCTNKRVHRTGSCTENVWKILWTFLGRHFSMLFFFSYFKVENLIIHLRSLSFLHTRFIVLNSVISNALLPPLTLGGCVLNFFESSF